MRNYGVITLTYWVFTLTDGALRMLVLLHLHQLGYQPLALASLFLLYEFFGVVTNFMAGWIGARYGLKSTLWSGLSLQIVATGLLAWQADHLTVALVMGAQALSGIAKDLTKMSAKSYVRLLVPADQHGRLLKWVAILTGSKNTLKGVGFFLGGWLLTMVGFRGANLVMMAALLVALLIAVAMLPSATGRSTSKVSLRHLFSKDPRINWLSAARLFLFGARDAWFVIALPVFLATEFAWRHSAVGGLLAVWIIGYGLVQALAPRLLRSRRGKSKSAEPVDAPQAATLSRWTGLLILPSLGLLGAFWLWPNPTTLVIGLAIFGAVFALNSAIHSYLILSYSAHKEVSLRVGFYYMANASGRLIGTILSGAIYQAAGGASDGLFACLAASLLMVTLSYALTRKLNKAEFAHVSY